MLRCLQRVLPRFLPRFVCPDFCRDFLAQIFAQILAQILAGGRKNPKHFLGRGVQQKQDTSDFPRGGLGPDLGHPMQRASSRCSDHGRCPHSLARGFVVIVMLPWSTATLYPLPSLGCQGGIAVLTTEYVGHSLLQVLRLLLTGRSAEEIKESRLALVRQSLPASSSKPTVPGLQVDRLRVCCLFPETPIKV